MQAFNGDSEIKQKYLDRVIAHQKADNLIRGTGWANGRGCAVGCTLEKYDHASYETELGIPEWLARLEDMLFENMSVEKSKTWPEEFLRAAQVGADLDKIKKPFIVMLLRHTLVSMDNAKYDEAAWPRVKAAIAQSKAAVREMIRCHEQDVDLSAAYSVAVSAASAAYSAAYSAASAADSAAYSAAYSAAVSASSAAYSAAYSAASAADSAAYSAAYSAAVSAYSAASTAYSVAVSAASAAYSAASADSTAASAATDYYADELLKLMRECK